MACTMSELTSHRRPRGGSSSRRGAARRSSRRAVRALAVAADPRRRAGAARRRRHAASGRSRSRRCTRHCARTTSAATLRDRSNAPRRRPPSSARSRASPTSAGAIAYLAGELQRRARRRQRRRAHRDPAHRRELRRRQGHRAPRPGERARASTRKRASPASAGTTAIAGHRTTYLAPFRHIDALRRRRPRSCSNMPYAHFTYTVIGQRVVAPDRRPRRGRQRRLHAARAVGLHAAVQRRKTPARVRAPDAHRAGRRRRACCPAARAPRPLEAPAAARARAAPALPPVLESLDPHCVSPLV